MFILAITISIISGRYFILKYKETKGRRIKSSGQTPFNIITKITKTAKGQLISKCPLGVIVSTKKPTKFF